MQSEFYKIGYAEALQKMGLYKEANIGLLMRAALPAIGRAGKGIASIFKGIAGKPVTKSMANAEQLALPGLAKGPVRNYNVNTGFGKARNAYDTFMEAPGTLNSAARFARGGLLYSGSGRAANLGKATGAIGMPVGGAVMNSMNRGSSVNRMPNNTYTYM